MAKLFLTSSASTVMDDIVKHFSKSSKSLKAAFINTASEAEKGNLAWLYADRDSLIKQGFEVINLLVIDLAQGFHAMPVLEQKPFLDHFGNISTG